MTIMGIPRSKMSPSLWKRLQRLREQRRTRGQDREIKEAWADSADDYFRREGHPGDQAILEEFDGEERP